MSLDHASKKIKVADSITQPSASCNYIDGSKGEGGGQILRNAISYACLLQKEIHIDNIRAGRSTPGLQAQHVTSLHLAVNISGGTLQGAAKNSTEVHYQPDSSLSQASAVSEDSTPQQTSRTIVGDTGTAGSICLLLQAALPCALLGSSQSATNTLILRGGTNADMAPQYDYWERVFLPTLHRCTGVGADHIQPNVVRRGYYPKGGGEVHVLVKPTSHPLKSIHLTDRGDVNEIYIRSFHAGKLGRHLAEQIALACRLYLKQRLVDVANWKEDVVTEETATGNGLGILVVAKTTTGCILAGSALCKPKQKADVAGETAAKELWDALSSGGCVDHWLQDQLILYMALADGESEILTGALTLHSRTAIMVAEEMTSAVFEVKKLSDGPPLGPVDSVSDSSNTYGERGFTPGKHLIRCIPQTLR
jgi:RNA 3'-terminal phosphate cyclase (ATP)